MRPCGGFTPDMINFAHSTNVYKIWADMIAFDRSETPVGTHAFCAFAGRRDGKDFALSDSDLMRKYYSSMRMVERIPDALADAMGNRMYVAVFPTKAELDAFYQDALAQNQPKSAEKAAKAPAPRSAPKSAAKASGKKPAAKAKKPAAKPAPKVKK